MIHIIENEYLRVGINDCGGTFWSIEENNGFQYLWEGDATIWADRDMVLFPYIARLFEGRYEYRGCIYEMDIHGFAKDTHFQLDLHTKDSICLSMKYTKETLKVYPFQFVFKIYYHLEKNNICIRYHIMNEGKETMYFGVGAHPGFKVPIDQGEFSDYFLEFSGQSKPRRIGMNEQLLRTGADEEYELQDDIRIDLEHRMFHRDAILLKDVCKQVTLGSKKSRRSVTLTYPNMNYLGIWHVPHTNAEYVCIEPWTSLPSVEGYVNDIEKQSDLIGLEAGLEYMNSWSVSIGHKWETDW